MKKLLFCFSLLFFFSVISEAQTNRAGDINVIVKGKRKTVDGPGDDITVYCRGRRKVCVIFSVPDEKRQGVTLPNDDGTPDTVFFIDAKEPVRFDEYEEDGVEVKKMTLRKIKK